MRHLTAVQPQGKSGGWHYASTSSRGGHPIGYCAEHDVHPTEAEARECYARWMRDHVHLDGKTSSWQSCRICKGPTQRYARVQYVDSRLDSLCDEHMTMENAVEGLGLNEPAGDAWQS